MEEQHMPGWVHETIMGQHPSFGADDQEAARGGPDPSRESVPLLPPITW